MVEFVDDVRPEVCPVVNLFTDVNALSAFLVWNGGEGAVKVISGDYFVVRRKFPENVALLLQNSEVNTVDLIEKIERCLQRVQKNYELTVLPWFAIDDTNSSVVQTFFRVLVRLRKFKVTKVYCESDARLRSEVESLNTRQLPLFDPSDYEELESVGQGGNARVYKMQHKVTGQLIAKKVILERNEDYPNCEREISEELSKIRHSERLYVQLACEARRNDVILQEFCAGGDLQQFEPNIETGFHLSETQIKRIVYHVAYAVKCLHAKGIAHRHLSLCKIALTSTELDQAEIKLLGLPSAAKQHSPQQSPPPDSFAADIKQIGVLTAYFFYGQSALTETEFHQQSPLLRLPDWQPPSAHASHFIDQLSFRHSKMTIADVLETPFLALHKCETVDQLRAKSQRLSVKCNRNLLFVQKHGAGAIPRLVKTLSFASELLETVRRQAVYDWPELPDLEVLVTGQKNATESLIVSFSSPQLAYI